MTGLIGLTCSTSSYATFTVHCDTAYSEAYQGLFLAAAYHNSMVGSSGTLLQFVSDSPNQCPNVSDLPLTLTTASGHTSLALVGPSNQISSEKDLPLFWIGPQSGASFLRGHGNVINLRGSDADEGMAVSSLALGSLETELDSGPITFASRMAIISDSLTNDWSLALLNNINERGIKATAKAECPSNYNSVTTLVDSLVSDAVQVCSFFNFSLTTQVIAIHGCTINITSWIILGFISSY